MLCLDDSIADVFGPPVAALPAPAAPLSAN